MPHKERPQRAQKPSARLIASLSPHQEEDSPPSRTAGRKRSASRGQEEQPRSRHKSSAPPLSFKSEEDGEYDNMYVDANAVAAQLPNRPSNSKSKSAMKLSSKSRKPKRPMTAYTCFVKKLRPVVMIRYPDMSFREVAIFVAAEWKNLTDTERRPYNGLADVDQVRFRREKVAFAKYEENEANGDHHLNRTVILKGPVKTPSTYIKREGGGNSRFVPPFKFDAIEVVHIQTEQEEVNQLALELAAEYSSSSITPQRKGKRMVNMVSIACQTIE